MSTSRCLVDVPLSQWWGTGVKKYFWVAVWRSWQLGFYGEEDSWAGFSNRRIFRWSILMFRRLAPISAPPNSGMDLCIIKSISLCSQLYMILVWLDHLSLSNCRSTSYTSKCIYEIFGLWEFLIFNLRCGMPCYFFHRSTRISANAWRMRSFVTIPALMIEIERNAIYQLSRSALMDEILLMDKILHHQRWWLSHYL